MEGKSLGGFSVLGVATSDSGKGLDTAMPVKAPHSEDTVPAGGAVAEASAATEAIVGEEAEADAESEAVAEAGAETEADTAGETAENTGPLPQVHALLTGCRAFGLAASELMTKPSY